MANTTKEQQRAELHKTIWSIADDLRGSVDGWDFKQYILCTLFYRFVSENLCTYLAEQEGDASFDYASMSDDQAEWGREETVKEKGFFILPSELFCNILKHVDKDGMRLTEDGQDLNELLSQIFKNIEGSAVGTESEGASRASSTIWTSTVPSSVTPSSSVTRSSLSSSRRLVRSILAEHSKTTPSTPLAMRTSTS